MISGFQSNHLRPLQGIYGPSNLAIYYCAKKKDLLLYDEVTEKNKERKGGKYHERKFDDQ
jgi:hypothetical protein